PVAYRLDLLEELNGVHDTFHVSNLKKCLADPTLKVPLDEIQVDAKLNFVEEPVEILEREFQKLKRSRIAIAKMRWLRGDGDGVVAAVVGCAEVMAMMAMVGRLLVADEGGQPMVAEEDGGDVVDVGFEWEVGSCDLIGMVSDCGVWGGIGARDGDEGGDGVGCTGGVMAVVDGNDGDGGSLLVVDEGGQPMVAEEDGGDVVDVGFEWEVVRRWWW
ncbi:hypothetical protein Tco_1540439, partial [Tanacetum coccineum]